MIEPLAVPPSRRTTHGAQMSPRLSRLYTWLQANNVPLTDFSTDECVKREMPKLVALAAELAELIERDTSDDALPGSRYLDHLRADLANIMRRTPDARVCSKTAAKVAARPACKTCRVAVADSDGFCDDCRESSDPVLGWIMKP